MTRSIALAAMLLVSSGAPLPARGAQEHQAPPPAFRSGTELVRLDVRVVDESGRPVGDLRADEIEIVENGRRRPIVLFQHISHPSAPLIEVARRTIAGEVSTNQGAPRGHLYVLVFDQGHITPGNEQRARAAAAQFLRTRVEPGDRVALYAVPGPGPQVDFTANAMRAIPELPKIRGSLDRFSYGSLGPMRIHEAFEITRGNQHVLTRVAARLSSERGSTDVLATAGRTAPRSGGANNALFEMLVKEDARTMVARADQQARNFLQMFADVIRMLRRIEGRKSVLLFSEGFFVDNVTRELELVAAAAAESYVVIHALDLNKRQVDIREQEPLGAAQYTEVQSRVGALGSLAAETDGLLMVDASETLDRSLSRIADDSQDYYLVGFEPGGRADRSGEYRRVDVRVRRAGARVQARTGYSAEALTEGRGDRRRTIDAALKAPFPQQGLPIRYTTYVLRSTSPGMQKVFMSLSCELPVDAGTSGRADVVFVVRSAQDGRVMASGTDAFPLPRVAAPGATTGTGEYRVQFELPAGAYLMRAIVREPGGLTGSADRRFEVRRLDRPDVTFSDLVLGDGRGALPVRAVAYTTRGLSGAMELYSPDGARLQDVSVSMEVAPIGAETPARVVTADLQEVRVADSVATRTARLSTPLTGVPAGDYLVTAVVRAGREQVGTVSREVRIAEGAPAAAVREPERLRPADVLDGRPAREYIRALHAAAVGTPLERAAAHALSGEWSQAAAALPPADTEPIDVHVALRGLARLGLGDYGTAAADLRRAYDAGNRTDALAGFVLGWAYKAAGDPREAIGAWRGAVYVDPLLVPAHLALADAYVQLAEPALAVQALRAGLASLPDSPELMNRLAEIQRPF